jgi:hypothetical protein
MCDLEVGPLQKDLSSGVLPTLIWEPVSISCLHGCYPTTTPEGPDPLLLLQGADVQPRELSDFPEGQLKFLAGAL